ncbi:tetratricopeptide repeat protein [Acrocarpospora sp. B8E8]|uniref:tetratricopeptide repeat protein n=1 Tax=Acrocarpospora sp. B8E8 TaxID=3153572 RepID=UPI00325E4A52
MDVQTRAEREEGLLALPDDAVRLFGLLGLHPGADFSVESAAALDGRRVGPVLGLLEAFAGVGLIRRVVPGRYRIDEPLRAHAAVRARRSATQADDALVRPVCWYLHACDWLQYALAPCDAYDLEEEVPAGVTPKTFDTPQAALAWWEDERATIVSIVRLAAQAGLHGLAWRMSAVLRAVYAHRDAVTDWRQVAAVGAASAVADGDLAGQALTAESLGDLHARTCRPRDAESHHRHALEIYRRLGDRFGQARSVNALGLLALRRRRLREACMHFEDSSLIFAGLDGDDMAHWLAVTGTNEAEALIELDRAAEAAHLLGETVEVFDYFHDRHSQGNALFLLARAHRMQGDLISARASIDAALAIATTAAAVGNPIWRGSWLLELGQVQRAAGQSADALEAYQRAADLHRELGHRGGEAVALDAAAELHREQGRAEEAVTLHRAAEAVHRELGDRWHQGLSLVGMGKALATMQRLPQARTQWQHALTALAVFTDPPATKLFREIQVTLTYLRGR